MKILFFTLIVVFLCACGQKKNAIKEAIVGTWETDEAEYVDSTGKSEKTNGTDRSVWIITEDKCKINGFDNGVFLGSSSTGYSVRDSILVLSEQNIRVDSFIIEKITKSELVLKGMNFLEFEGKKPARSLRCYYIKRASN